MPNEGVVRSVIEQAAMLKMLFPDLHVTFDERVATRPLPLGAEGWFAIPRWEVMAPTYRKAVEYVFTALSSQRIFSQSELEVKHFRRNARTTEMFYQISDRQWGYTILIVPCQFNLRPYRRSTLLTHRARAIFRPNEFGLDMFTVGIILLTHPEMRCGPLSPQYLKIQRYGFASGFLPS